MKMKVLKTTLVLAICGVILFSLSCSGSSTAATPTTQTSVVKKGNIGIDVTATGNLAFSRIEDLAFEVAGTVEDVSVKVGDSVTEGNELVKLDTSEWDKQVKTLEKALATAQRSLSTQESNVAKAERTVTTKESAVAQAERTVASKESAVTQAERQVASKEMALRQAQIDLDSAKNNLNKIAAIKAAQDALDNADATLQLVESVLTGQWAGALTVTNPLYWTTLQTTIQQEKAKAQADLQALLSGTSTATSADAAIQIANLKLQYDQKVFTLESAQIAVTDAQTAVEDAKLAVKDAQTAVEDAKQAVEDAKTALYYVKLDKSDAEQTVKDTQTALDEAKSLSPIIKAPFTGFVTKVNVEGGDDVQKGTVALQIADPTKFQASVLVSEQDISSIKLDADATVKVDVMNTSVPAKITAISPTATISQGVVNYSVTIEVQNTPTRQTTSQQGTTQIAPSPEAAQERINQMVQQGRITQQQADEMINRIKSGQTFQFSPGQTTPSQSAAPSQSITLKQGLSITITIPILQKNDVLLVPNRAISRQGKDTVVNVIKDGVTSTRVITVGLSDLSNTEVTSGLTEGEVVVLPTATSSGTSSTQRTGQGGMFFQGVPR